MIARRVIFLIAATGTLTACNRTVATARTLATAGVHGTYAHGRSWAGREEYLRIDADSITKTVICRDGEDMETVEVTAPARVTPRTFEIERPALDVRRVGDIDCVARLDQGSVDYHVDRYHKLTLHPHFGGWRRTYVMIGAERPGLWQEVREDAAVVKKHLKRFGSRVKDAIRRGADVYVESKTRQVELNVEMIDRTYDGVSKLSRRLKPAPHGENE